MIGWLTIYSMGRHLFMPMANSIGMNLVTEGQMGKILGQINSLNTAVFLFTSLTTALLFRYIKIDYHVAFSLAAVGFFLSAVLILAMKPPNTGRRVGERFVLRKEYNVFYGLSVLFGARKQIFITFELVQLKLNIETSVTKASSGGFRPSRLSQKIYYAAKGGVYPHRSRVRGTTPTCRSL